MAFPGDRKIVQHARGVADQFDDAVLAEGEICILMSDELEDWEIRVGDGSTPGGVRFMTKEYIDIVAGNGGIQAGTDEMASIGIDTEQRTWPATSFSLFAKKDSALLTGVPTLETQPGVNDSTLRLANTAWVAQNFMKAAYVGSDVDEVVFPIGHPVISLVGSGTAQRNQTPSSVLRLSTANSQEYVLGGVGTPLAGTWRSRGRIPISTPDTNCYQFVRTG